jgi:hypothetical protein
MSEKRCPNCKELVPSNSLTCPKCFAQIHRDAVQDINENKKKDEKKNKSMKIAMFLATIPALIGLLGLGRIYLDPKDSRGYWYLVIGLVLFLPLLALLFTIFGSGPLTVILLLIALVILSLVYISAAVAIFFDTVFGSVFRIFNFGSST